MTVKKDPGDFYGLFSNNTSFENLYYASGMSVIKPDAAGTIVISPDFSGEKMVSLLEKLCRAFHESDGCSFGTEENAYAVTAFMEERALFFLSGVSAAPNYLRDVGLTHTPKWPNCGSCYARPYQRSIEGIRNFYRKYAGSGGINECQGQFASCILVSDIIL